MLPSLLLTLIASTQAIDLRECRRALGMESGAIRDDQISASSSFSVEYAGPQHGRAGVESGSGAWCPAGQISATSREFIEIDLRETTMLTGVKTMGRYDDGRGNEFARFYRVEYWRESVGEWRRLITGDLHEILQGNTDTRSPHTSWIEGGVVVEKVRILPVSNSTRTICMRVELYGCPYKDAVSSYSMRDGERADGLDLTDGRFDGRKEDDGRLEYGIGKLYDGLLGFEDHESHPERWVGWRAKGRKDTVAITVNFASRLNVSAVLLHTSNYRRYNAQIFTAILLEFSINGRDFSSRSLSLPYESDSFENLRWVRVPVPHRLAKSIRITLTLPPFPRWLLLSELQFESDGAPLSLPLSPDTVPVTTVVKRAPAHQDEYRILSGTTLLIIAAAALLMLLIVCACKRRQRRVKSSSPHLSKQMFASHHIMMEDGTTKTIVSPSTYAMARDNRTNELIEKIPLHDEDEDDRDTIYAEPDSMDDDLSSSQLYKAPLLCSSTATTLSIRRGTLPTKPLIPSRDCGVYSTLLPAISRSQIEFIRPIGQGEFGKVHLARLERRRLVAVKSLHKRDAAAEASFEKEVRVLGALRHHNVVEVIGVVAADGDAPMCCVMQFMARGDLKKHLTSHPVDCPTALSFCVQIAAGMSYLESQGYVHRDVAARNCLLDDELVVKMGDFGMARSLYADEYYTIEGECRLPVRWMAPESLLMGKFSTASDVWSFAVTCWEVLTRCDRLPYPTLTHEQVVDRLTRAEGLFLPCPDLCPEWMYRELLQPCWSVDPQLRPTFQAIHHYLQSAQHKQRG
ncbi:hypothetical protein PFISCL1PPCAC_25802 [Pristionchus fissidentatus]|uniref:receptor protein-tyrosine kinase n=1 Tax=Pristionchus fissidentatus TaxID=1538716 RepID=A0AAV5WSD0_9BILA|nr:hypothetical protein PFISCL1PPCAC_25802 [Pristionchus fissidentatus]